MSVSGHAPPTIDPVVESLLAADPKTGAPSKVLVALLTQLRDYILGSGRIVPCDASGTANAIVLTPNNPVSPIMSGYAEHDGFAFTASASSSASVTASVISRDGNSMGSLKVYKTAGAAQAGNGDVVIGSFYVAFYVSSLDSGNGGLVLK